MRRTRSIDLEAICIGKTAREPWTLYNHHNHTRSSQQNEQDKAMFVPGSSRFTASCFWVADESTKDAFSFAVSADISQIYLTKSTTCSTITTFKEQNYSTVSNYKTYWEVQMARDWRKIDMKNGRDNTSILKYQQRYIRTKLTFDATMKK